MKNSCSLLIMISILQFACSSQKLKISTNVKAELYASNDFVSKGKKAGITPGEYDVANLSDGKDFAFLSVVSDGYHPYRLILPTNFSGGEIKIELKEQDKYTEAELKDKVEKSIRDSLETDYNKRYAEIISKTLEFQSALAKRKLVNSARLLAEIKNLQPPEATLAILQGNFQYVSGQPRSALALYERALELDPANRQIKVAIGSLKRKLAGQ